MLLAGVIRRFKGRIFAPKLAEKGGICAKIRHFGGLL
jgi:hypothetical protein